MAENEKPETPATDKSFHTRIYGTGDRIESIRGSIEKNDSTIKDESVSPPPPPKKKE